jgi:peptidoglycan L-alanyl-D-glutamate endopeptidase CwlK
MTRLIDLNKETYYIANHAIAELQDLKIPHVITSTKRTLEEQQALYAQGREKLEEVNRLREIAGMRPIGIGENGYTVTNCDGIKNKSNHQSGDAIDIVPMENGKPIWPDSKDRRWNTISFVMIKHGFEWGGNWKLFPDFPHYQRVIK